MKFANDSTSQYNERGLAKRMLGDNAGALEDYDDALELEPRNHSARINRALLKENEGKLDEAMGTWIDASQMDALTQCHFTIAGI